MASLHRFWRLSMMVFLAGGVGGAASAAEPADMVRQPAEPAAVEPAAGPDGAVDRKKPDRKVAKDGKGKPAGGSVKGKGKDPAAAGRGSSRRPGVAGDRAGVGGRRGVAPKEQVVPGRNPGQGGVPGNGVPHDPDDFDDGFDFGY